MRARHRLRLGAALLLAAGAACDDPTGTARDDALLAVTTRHDLRLTNVSDEPVWVLVIGRREAALVDLNPRPCVDAAVCPPIAPGGTRVAPRPTFDGRPEREAVVYYWRAAPDSAGVPRATRWGSLTVGFP